MLRSPFPSRPESVTQRLDIGIQTCEQNSRFGADLSDFQFEQALLLSAILAVLNDWLSAFPIRYRSKVWVVDAQKGVLDQDILQKTQVGETTIFDLAARS